MPGIRTVAILIGIINGIWTAAVVAWLGYYPSLICSPNFCGDNILLLGLGVILVIVSAICYFGLPVAFYISAIVAAVIAIRELLVGIGPVSPAFIVSLVLAVATVVLDIAGARARTTVSEADHPLNLPVFG